MLRNILQCMGQVPTTKHFLAQAVSSAEIGIPGQVSGVSECMCMCVYVCVLYSTFGKGNSHMLPW